MDKILLTKIYKIISIILVFLGIYFLVKHTFMYIYPFILALLVSMLLHPLVSKMEVKWKLNRAFATLLTMLLFFTSFITLSVILLKRLLNESTSLVETLPKHFANIKIIFFEIGQSVFLPFYEKLVKAIPFLPPFEELDFNAYIAFLIDELLASSSFFLKNVMLTTSNIFSSLSHIVTIFIFILLSSFMMTKDFHVLRHVFQKFIPKRLIDKGQQILYHVKHSVFGFMKAQVIITIISSIIVFIGLSVLRVENVVMISLIVLLVDFIPYVGIGIIFIPWILYSFFTGEYIFTIQLAALYIIVILIRQFIEPRILASSIGIHPLIALMVLFFGLQSLGIAGIFLAPVFLILISAIYHAGVFHYLWKYITQD